MRWYVCRRSRTLCLSFAFATVFLHLLFLLVSFSARRHPCDPQSSSPPAKTDIFRGPAHAGFYSTGVSGIAKPPVDTAERDVSDTAAGGDPEEPPAARKADAEGRRGGGGHASLDTAAEAGQSGHKTRGPTKFEALFSHPLYNMPVPPVPEEDMLLKVKPRPKTGDRSSQEWVSASQEGYDNIQWSSTTDSHPPWLRFHLGISRWQLYPHHDPNMEALVQQLAMHRIVSAVQKSGGTQLKLVISFPNYGRAMLKPMKQERDEETNYNLFYFSDFERHNAELAAFHLDRILGYRRIPPVVGRLVDVVKEIKNITTDRKLAKTFFTSPVGNVCFYGQCSYYCSTEHAICGRPHALEASLAVMLPDLALASRKSWRSPWRRSYSRSKLAKWETDHDYCSTVKKTAPYNKGTRLVDFIDMVILDFLMNQHKHVKLKMNKDKKRKTGMESRPREVSLTGAEVLEIIAKKKSLSEFDIFYLKEEDGYTYRPYDLRVVDPSDAGSEHYIFFPTSVLHVTEKGYGGLVTLAEWHRESVLWRALRKIPFFRDYRLRKAFTWWWRHVRKITFQRKCGKLQGMMLMAIPQYRQALFLFSSVIEELKEVHWLPQDEWRTYTLQEFNDILITKSQECLKVFERVAQYRTVILEEVQRDSYQLHEELLMYIEHSKKTNKRSQPLHLHLACQRDLEKEAAQVEHALQKLGHVAALLNHMTVQSLVTIVQQEATSFLNKVIKRGKVQQGCLFQAELIFNAHGQLTLDPPMHFFQIAVQKALLSVGDSTIKMSDTCGFFWETKKTGAFTTIISGSAQEVMPDPSPAGYRQLPAVSGEHEDKDNGIVGLRKPVCRQDPRDQLTLRPVLPRLPPLIVQGHRLRGCYRPLSKKQLEWHLTINDVSKVVEKEQARIMQEAEAEVQQLCDEYAWLVDVNFFTRKWSAASLEALKGQPAFIYEEHIKKLRHWTERIQAFSASFTTSNHLFVICCTSIKEELGLRLKSTEEDLLKQLVHQMKLHSKDLISDLKTAIAELKTEPQDLDGFANYAAKVRRCEKMLANTQQRIEYVRSLQGIAGMSCRKMSEQQMTLDEQMESLWDCYVPLLKQADELMGQRLPSLSDMLDHTFSSFVCDLDKSVSTVTSGPFLDPTQNASEMCAMLNTECRKVHSVSSQLKELSRTRTLLIEQPLDLMGVETAVRNIEARKELWELMTICTVEIKEWRHLLFSKFVVSQAQEKVAAWQQQALSLTENIPAHNAVLQEILKTLQHFTHQLSDMARLHSPAFKDKHWRKLFKGVGLLYVPEMTLTVDELIFKLLGEHQKETEKMEKFHPVDKTFKEIIHTTSSDPHVLNIVGHMKTNDHFYGYHLRMALINGLSTMEAIFNQMLHLLDAPREKFPRLCFLSDREVMELLSLCPTPYTLLPITRKCFKGVCWFEVDCKMPIYRTDLSSGQNISNTHEQTKVLGIFGSFREHIPFFSPLEPNLNPLVWLCDLETQLQQTMMRLVKQCSIARKQLKPIDIDLECNAKAEDIQFTNMKEDVPTVLKLVSDYPLQCLLIAEEEIWCNEVLRVNQASTPVTWIRMKTHVSSKLKKLCFTIRKGLTCGSKKSLVSNRTKLYLQALVQITMNHAQQLTKLMEVKCELELSFEWQSLMKYHITYEVQKPNAVECPQECQDDSQCYVDVLGSWIPYGYEYVGPNHLTMVNTPSTDRAILGILFALTSYRCGFVSGPCMSGKSKIVFQLGRALGRQVIALKCCLSISPNVVQQMLLGALQTGAWLVLDSVDSMTQGELSLLGQQLADIHQSFTVLMRNSEHRTDGKPKDWVSEVEKNVKHAHDPGCLMSFAGRNIFAKQSYGCVIISSKRYTTEVPESLRAATRAIALTCPSYRIFTEVLLASIGFSEAASLSRRLVSLLSMAQDSLCLPDFIKQDQTTWLGVLQNVITASAGHLKQGITEQEVSDEGNVSAEEGKAHEFPHNLPVKSSKTEVEGKEKKKHSSRAVALIKGVMEELAVVKALSSILLPSIHDSKKALQFCTIFKETFPMAHSVPFTQQCIEEEEEKCLKDAVTEELQRTGFQSDAQMISSVLTLYRAMRISRAVLLMGPSGSGKTTCYRVLAGALNSLARAVEDVFNEEDTNEGDTPLTDPQAPVSTWSSVDTVILFPNSMSHEEMFGAYCEERGWWDGAFTKALRGSERCHLSASAVSSNKQKVGLRKKVQWLVLDGEPLRQAGWLDCFSTLCCADDPSLCLASGERFVPPESELKLLAEITDLSDVTPSTVTRCGFVCFIGSDLWKAVWKAEMEALCAEQALDQETLKMWKHLAQDLFCSTLHLLRQNGLTPAMYSDEVRTSEHYTSLQGAHVAGTDVQIAHEIQTRNLFLVAYIWGFGGHLHPRHWPQFDLLARQVLFDSRYRVEVPDKRNVFEHFFTQGEGTVNDIISFYSYHAQYEKYTYLLDFMLDANQPVLLVGEAGSGKTTLCESLLSQNRQYINLPASPLLKPCHLHSVLDNIGYQRTCRGTERAVIKQSALLLFVDDLHEAPCDPRGNVSEVLETLRQSISKGGALTSDGYHFKLFRSKAINYMATCCPYGPGNPRSNVISSRLFRLFSIIVLPSLCVEVLFSIHSPRLKLWLSNFPYLPPPADMALCIISATQDLYCAVLEQFQPTFQRLQFIFSHHDLQRVFQGMCMLEPIDPKIKLPQRDANPVILLSKSAASVLNIARLWMHECLRTFSDRLCSEDDAKMLVSLITKVSEAHYGSVLIDEPKTLSSIHTTANTIPVTPTLAAEPKSIVHSTSQISGTPDNRDEDRGPSPLQLTTNPLAAFREEKDSILSDRPDRSECGTLDSGLFWDSKTEDNSFDDITMTQKGPKSFGQSDWKRSHKVTELTLQTEGRSSDEPSLPIPLLLSQCLQDTEKNMDKIVYGPEFSEPLNLVGQQPNFRCNSCYQERDFDLLVQQLCTTVKRKAVDGEEGLNDNYSIMSSYLVHKQMVHHLLHIMRALLIPGGHGVLFGSARGTGRKTDIRLATYVMGCHLVEVHSSNEEKLHDILKAVLSLAGVNSGEYVILAHENISQAVREELLVLMAHGTCPGLYHEGELTNLVLRMNAVQTSRRSHTHDQRMLEKYFAKSRKSVHVFLLMPFITSHSSRSSADQTQHWKAHMAKALSLSCCVEVYHPWSSQSLEEAAAHRLHGNPYLYTSDGKKEQADQESSVSRAMAGIHQSACRYASVLLDAEPFSPQTYVELITHFSHLCSHLHKHGLEPANRVAAVLACVEDLTEMALQYKQDLVRLQEKLAETQQGEEELLRTVAGERVLLEGIRQRCVREERNLCQLEEQLHQARQRINFEESTPFLLSLKTLEYLSPSDLEEVRHYTKPPEGVVKIMEAVCLLFDRPHSWESAKQLLAKSNFFQGFEFFDRHRLTDDQLQQLGQILDSPHFQPESVREVSRACESLCRWVRAVYRCACMERHLAPQETRKWCLNELAAEVRSHLRMARLQEEEVCQRLEQRKHQLQLVRKEVEELLMELRRAESLERQAAAAVTAVESNMADWNAAAQEAELNQQTLPGDALILAAIISYLGPFGPDIRTELISKWRKLCLTGTISIDPEDPRTPLFTETDPIAPGPSLTIPIPVTEKLHLALARAVGVDRWQIQGLSARLVVKLILWGYMGPHAQHWPLLANAQHHEKISILSTLMGERTTFEVQAECGMVICADDPELLNKLDQAAKKGCRVLVTHVECAVPSPQFLAMLMRHPGSHPPGFSLFFSTHLPTGLLGNEIHPSILAEVRVVDLSLSTTEIQELMLSQLLQSVCSELLIQHNLLKSDKRTLQAELVKVKVSLEDLVLQSSTLLLQDSTLLPRVAACQKASQKLQEEIQQLNVDLEHHEALLASPRRAAVLAASLYQALQEVARLSPVYFFSLHSFIVTVRGALPLRSETDVSHTSGQVTDEVMSEIIQRMVDHLLAQYRPCLFQSHATLLKLLVSVALLQHNHLCSEGERAAFLRGLQGLDLQPSKAEFSSSSSTTSPHDTSQNAVPSWIPAPIHPELLCLERIPAFRGLITSLATSPRHWQEYLHSPSSTVLETVPCHSHSHLSLLQRALLWKTMLPDCLSGVAEVMATCHLGLSGRIALDEAPHTGNPKALSQFIVKHEGPVILTLPDPGKEKWASIEPVQLLKQLACCQEDLTQVQVKVISFGARCEMEVIHTALDKAVNDGQWLVFNNCHLLDHWDDKMVHRLNQLTCHNKGGRTDKESSEDQDVSTDDTCTGSLVHPCFRLWFITREQNPHHIPATVRIYALHLVCDSPWDLKEALSCSLRQVMSTAQSDSQSGVTGSPNELLLRCAILHSVLVQRHNYKYQGQGNVYHWTQLDLLALVDAHFRIARLCKNNIQALEYIAVNLVYGGHVSDSADLEVVKSVAGVCLNEGTSLSGSGPRVLANIISVLGHLDASYTSRMLHGLEHRVQDLANITDSLVLGFSAHLAAEMVKIKSKNLNVLLRDSQSPLRRAVTPYQDQNHIGMLPDYSQARIRLEALKRKLAHGGDGVTESGPLCDFLLSEWDGLRGLVSLLLSQLQVPFQHRLSSPSCLFKVANLPRLERRAELLKAYLWGDAPRDPPATYHLSAFSNAKGFLVAVMREAAQTKQRDISNVALHFQVLSVSPPLLSSTPGGVYLCGLELRGALWDTQLGALQDTLSPQPCLLPLLHVTAGASSTDTVRHPLPCDASQSNNSNPVPNSNPNAPPSNAAGLPVFHCPLCLDGGGESGDWGLGDSNVITRIPLLAKLNPVLCSLRRVRIVSTL
ncbi:dynein heavy chain domain-containing protein 1 [Lampris incognitus]|uniref:dynein heavy chain domain-containing protein 1 n=1 Tax=Lampris incognitus TaxID=2546036 RepID=UPI0024B4B5E1|nr:dynein heavy chain domain-containing protein 1 [Lampris incognitus]